MAVPMPRGQVIADPLRKNVNRPTASPCSFKNQASVAASVRA